MCVKFKTGRHRTAALGRVLSLGARLHDNWQERRLSRLPPVSFYRYCTLFKN